jgi:hypothetical protein
VTFATPPRGRRRRRRGRKLGVWALRLLLALVLLGVGIALGRALEDNPTPGVTVTKERPLTFTVTSR